MSIGENLRKSYGGLTKRWPITSLLFRRFCGHPPRYGGEGAAWAWVGLNAGYLLIGVHFMYRRILRGEKWSWYFQDVVFPHLGALSGALVAWCLNHAGQAGPPWIPFVVGPLGGMIAVLTASMVVPRVRAHSWLCLHPYLRSLPNDWSVATCIAALAAVLTLSRVDLVEAETWLALLLVGAAVRIALLASYLRPNCGVG